MRLIKILKPFTTHEKKNVSGLTLRDCGLYLLQMLNFSSHRIPVKMMNTIKIGHAVEVKLDASCVYRT